MFAGGPSREVRGVRSRTSGRSERLWNVFVVSSPGQLRQQRPRHSVLRGLSKRKLFIFI